MLATMPVRRSEMSDLAYTKRKIEANFSNFSAWHQRSKVLTTLWEGNKLDPVKSKAEGQLRLHAPLPSPQLTHTRILSRSECDVYGSWRSECVDISPMAGWRRYSFTHVDRSRYSSLT